MKTPILLFVLLALSGCVSSPFISESSLNERTQQVVKEYQLRAPITKNLQNTELRFNIEKTNIDLQSNNGGQVVLSLDGTIIGTVNILGLKKSLEVPLSPKLVAALRYENGSIYLNSPSLLEWGGNVPQPLSESLKPFERVISLYLEEVPIYTLDHSMEEKLAAKFIRSLTIQDDKLLLNP